MDTIFRFARYEADRERYQLRCEAHPIKIERIPLELLFLLLENSGKLVSRNLIVSKVWAGDVFLDTERSINTAIRKIRKALEDDPHHPQFIETVVGQGYRFIAPFHSDNPALYQRLQIQSRTSTAGEGTAGESDEIRLRDFRVERMAGEPVLSCDVVVSNIALGRVPLVELQLPVGTTFPLTPEHRLLLKFHGVGLTLTAKTVQALHAFSLSILEDGLRTRVTGPSLLHNGPHQEQSLPVAGVALDLPSSSGPA